MAYTPCYPNKRNWANLPSESSPINETNLNAMDNAIYTNDGRIVELSGRLDTDETALGNKVDKQSGKGLSEIKSITISPSVNTGTKIAEISYKNQDNLTIGYEIKNGVVVDSALSSSSENPVQNKVVKSAVDAKSTVSISDTLVTGDTIANLTIDGTTTAIKAPLVEVDDTPSATSENPLQNKAIYEMLNNLLPEGSESGNPISIDDASGLNAKACSVDLLPIQDLHGYDNPWVGGAGKNKLITPDLATLKNLNTGGTWSDNKYTFNGVTYTVITDNDGNVTGINTDGTATGGLSDFYFTTTTRKTLDNYGLVVGNSYIFTSGLASDVSGAIMMFNGAAANIEASASGRTFIVNSTDVYSINIRVYNNTTVNNVLFKPMIRLATETDSTFAPYENICPISGRVSVELERTGKNSAKNDNATNPNRNDYTYSVETDDKVIGKKTIVGGSFFVKYSMFVKEGVTYTFSFGKYTIDGTEQNSANIYVYSDELWGNSLKPNWNVSKSGSSWKSTYTGKVVLGIFNGSSVNTILEIDDLQVEIGSTATTYEAYQGETYTETLGQTVYGGKVDFVNGKLTIDKTFYTFNGTETWYVNASGTHSFVPLNMKSGANMDGISSIFPTGTNRGCVRFGTGNPSNPNNRLYLIEATQAYGADTSAKLNTLTNGSTICYPLATPIEIRLTAEQISLLKGNNVVSTDGDSIKLVYSADIKAWVENQLQS